MATLLNTGRGGSDTTTVTTGNSGGNSGNAWSTVNITGTGATLTYSTDQSLFGSPVYKFATTTSTNAYLLWNGGGLNTTTVAWGVVYVYMATAYVSGFRPISFYNSSIQLQGCIQLGASGLMTMVNSAGTSSNPLGTVAVGLGAWVRIELWIKSSNTAGQLEAKLFKNPHSLVPDETITSAATINTRGGNVGAAVFGWPSTTTTTRTQYMTGVGVTTDAGYLGTIHKPGFALL